MDRERWTHLQAIFERAADFHGDERETFLDKECAGDDELRREVENLLAADEAGHTGFGKQRQDAIDLDKHLEGSEIGAYRLIKRVGVGGMGSVFLAERSDGSFERQVALKVVKKGMDTEMVVRRFEMERQILARLDHPNVARLLDGGITDDGRPYFVMEYIDGVPLTEYCDKHRLNIHERLQLFRLVCSAVQYAHQHLIVHRDLKPSNILVTDNGEVKLLDFGIAKLLDEDESSNLTRTGVRVFTPAYAAPEQLLNEAITTETDVYALGIVLYELLSGRRPFEAWRTESELREHVLKATPLRPSTAITQAPADDKQLEQIPTVEELSKARSTPVTKLRKLLTGDLDTICLMAIRRNPEKRYSSAEQMAEDINRHLRGIPVVARADTVGYRLAKFLQRHRAGVAITAAVVIGFVAVVSFYTAQITHERDIAIDEQQKVSEIVGFVTGLFEISDPYESRGQDITARDLLDAGVLRIHDDLADRPAVQASMMRVLGEVYYSLDSLDEAEQLLSDALQRQQDLGQSNSLETATIQLHLGLINQDRGNYPVAGEFYDKALTIRRTVLGNDHEEVMEAISAQAYLDETEGEFDRAERLHIEALDMARRLFSGDDLMVAESLSSLAGIYRIKDQADKAEPLLREAIAMLDRLFDGEHPLALKIQRQLAGLLRNSSRFEEAEPMYLKIIEAQERMLGPDHHELSVTWNGYAQLLADQGKRDATIDAYQTALDIIERGHDGPHPSLGPSYNNQAYALRDAGRLDEALVYFERSLEMQDAVNLPPRHVNRTFPTTGLASVYYRQERYAEAEVLFRDMLQIRLESFGEEHRSTSEIKSDLAAVLIATARYEEAETLLLDAYQRFDEDRGVDDPRTQRAARRLAELYEALDQPDKAKPYRDIFQGEF